MEGDAGTRQLNPTDADETPDESLAVSQDEQTDPTTEASAVGPLGPQLARGLARGESPEQEPVDEVLETRRPSRLGRGWVAAICAALLVLAVGGAVGGFLALKSHQQSEAVARAEAAALQAAKDCVAATHAPDTAAMTAAQTKMIECFTGDMTAQATLYSSVFIEAYQAADVKVAVSDMRAAVEKHNDDGTVDVLVAVRVRVTNSEAADQEQGYRLRLKMTPYEGTYKVVDIQQVTS